MKEQPGSKEVTVLVYNGYGHTHNMTIFGHVLNNKPRTRKRYSKSLFVNLSQLINLFMVEPLPAAEVQLLWRGQVFHTTTQPGGYFKFEWQSETSVEAGWHDVVVKCLDTQGRELGSGTGQIEVPHTTQFGFISDIDDTVLVSGTSAPVKKFRLLFTKNPHTRKAFADAVKHYQLFSLAQTTQVIPNPFFYISNSEWNLYYDQVEFFTFNGLPKGSFMLGHIKRWYQLLKTGEPDSNTKMKRAERVLETFPKRRFVLLGDNSQKDPDIYASLVNKYPGRVFAIYIRDINSKNQSKAKNTLATLESAGVFTCLFSSSEQAIAHAREIKLIT